MAAVTETAVVAAGECSWYVQKVIEEKLTEVNDAWQVKLHLGKQGGCSISWKAHDGCDHSWDVAKELGSLGTQTTSGA